MASSTERKVTSHNEKSKKLPIHIKLVVGAIAGAVGTSCIFPIDMIKTRLQSAGKYDGPIDCLKKIYTTEGGIRAFYKGLSANLIGVIPEKAIKLAANEALRELFEKEDGSIELLHEIISGAGAGFMQVIATNPMEITKIRMQMQATLPLAERQTLAQIVRTLGLSGMYRGTLATLSRDVPFSIFYFPGYANLKKLLADDDGKNSTFSLLLAGGGAGAVAAGMVTPTDVIKTRLQLVGGKEKYKDMPTALRRIMAEEGVGALFKGAVPRMIVVGPLFAITQLSFEAMKTYMIQSGQL